jgi:hypothetical protein
MNRDVVVSRLLEHEKDLVRGVQFRTGFRVYLHLLKLRSASTKDIQKAMGFPTPAQAKYHLKRLVELGLAREDESGYSVVEKRFGVLRFFFKARNSIFPLSLFYSIFFGLLTVLLFLRSPSIEIALLGGLITAKELADTYSYFRML